MKFTVRKCTDADLSSLAVIFDKYRQFYRQESNVEAAEKFLRERFVGMESVVFIAVSEQDGQLLGFAQLYPLFSSVNMRSTWLLNDLYVDPAARRLGVGRSLLDASEEFGRQSGAIGIELETEKSNENAKALYENQNWVRDVDHDRYSLSL